MKNITLTAELEEHCGVFSPKDPWKFAKDIENNQDWRNLKTSRHNILFNKGRYFETSIDNKQVLSEVSELINSPVKYDNMIVDSWRKLEDFVIAMNCLGIYVSITIDWI